MIEVNGKPHTPRMPEQCSVLQCLREELGLNGPKLGCGEGECGACTVLVDGLPQTSCNLPLWDAQGKKIVGYPNMQPTAARQCEEESASLMMLSEFWQTRSWSPLTCKHGRSADSGLPRKNLCYR